MERARHTHLDGVTLDGILTTFKFEQLSARSRTRTASGQARSEHVGNLHQLGVAADGTRLASRTANVRGGSQKFGVGVTDVLVTQCPCGELREQGVADEPKLDYRPIGSAGTKALNH
jgi:hypothetical protein